MRAFQYRIYPNKEQREKLWIHANKLNKLYNYFLDQRIQAYQNKAKVSKKDQQAELVKLKETDPSLKEIHSQVLQQVTLRLNNSYKAFYSRVKSKGAAPGFPKFRSCKNFFGICYPQSGFFLDKGQLKTKAYGKIPMMKHREIKGDVKQIYITTKNDKWFVSVITDFSPSKTKSTNSIIAIDVGVTDLVVTSDGQKTKNCSHARYFDKQIAKIQSRADKLKQGSRKRKSLNNVKRRLYDLKVRKIRDFQHKVSKKLSSKYDTIYAENLSVKRMTESEKTGLNKANRNAKLATFINYLSYKTKKLVLVNPKNTSKTCNSCGKIHQDLEISDRIINCDCGVTFDRDINAAINILCLGQAIDQDLCTESSTIQEALAFRRE